VGVTLSNQGSKYYHGGIVSESLVSGAQALAGGQSVNPNLAALRRQVVGIALTQEGVTESGANSGREVRTYLSAVDINQPDKWCVAFVFWCFEQASNLIGAKNPMKKTASTTELYDYGKKSGGLLKNLSEVRPGDIMVLLKPIQSNRHTGLVIEVDPKVGIVTMEGNSSNKVRRVTRSLKNLQREYAEFINIIGDQNIVGTMMQAGTLLGNVNKGSFSTAITKYSRALGVDESLVSAMIEAESNQRHYNKDGSIYTSGVGAAGVAQIMPETAGGIAQNYQAELQKVLGIRVTKELILTDPNVNLAAGIVYLKAQIQRIKGAYPNLSQEEQYRFALASYNAGYGAVKKYHGVPPPSFAKGQTYDYVSKIMKNYRILKGK
jgi:hypothetical protein